MGQLRDFDHVKFEGWGREFRKCFGGFAAQRFFPQAAHQDGDIAGHLMEKASDFSIKPS